MSTVTILAFYVPKNCAVDRHHFYADPDPNFHSDADPNPDLDLQILQNRIFCLFFIVMPVYSTLYYLFHQSHNFKILGCIEIFRKRVQLTLSFLSLLASHLCHQGLG